MENEIEKLLDTLTAGAVSSERIDTISSYLDDWKSVSFEDRRQVADMMITVIRATSEKLCP